MIFVERGYTPSTHLSDQQMFSILEELKLESLHRATTAVARIDEACSFGLYSFITKRTVENM